MEVFWIGEDGSIQDRFYYDGAGWNGFTLYPAGSALGAGSPAGAITAVSREWNTLEIWWIGGNYSVQDAYWYQGGFWNRFGPPWSQSRVTPAGPPALNNVAAVSRASNHLDVFYVTYNGGIGEAAS